MTGDNGLLTKAGEAKNASEIAEEKDIISISAIQAQSENNYGNLEESKFNEALNTNSKIENKASIVDSDIENYTIKFESGRFYKIDRGGNISNAITKEKIEFPGDITQNGMCDGSLENPYKIYCIEDLICFFKNNNSQNNYENKYITLMRTLDFNSIFSYNDFTTIEYDIYLGGNGTTGLKEQLTQGGKGFKIKNGDFKGHFNGLDNKIIGLYINTNLGKCGLFEKNTGDIEKINFENININIRDESGLICYSNNGNIHNIQISGNMVSEGSPVNSCGIICANNDLEGAISQITNYATISGGTRGKGSIAYRNKGLVEKCINFRKNFGWI